jgi:diguanylate cyclase (GGDEF)-like protein
MLLTIALVSSGVINAALILWLIDLSKRIGQMSVCPTYQCLTRQGVDRRWQKVKINRQGMHVIFLDIDNMHKANELWGYAEVDAKIARSLKQVRQNELVGRWYAGDEIVLICNATESYQTAERIQLALESNGLSATFGIATCDSPLLAENAKRAADLVQAAKERGDRGGIHL